MNAQSNFIVICGHCGSNDVKVATTEDFIWMECRVCGDTGEEIHGTLAVNGEEV